MKTQSKSSDWPVAETILVVVFSSGGLMRRGLGGKESKGTRLEGNAWSIGRTEGMTALIMLMLGGSSSTGPAQQILIDRDEHAIALLLSMPLLLATVNARKHGLAQSRPAHK